MANEIIRAAIPLASAAAGAYGGYRFYGKDRPAVAILGGLAVGLIGGLVLRSFVAPDSAPTQAVPGMPIAPGAPGTVQINTPMLPPASTGEVSWGQQQLNKFAEPDEEGLTDDQLFAHYSRGELDDNELEEALAMAASR